MFDFRDDEVKFSQSGKFGLNTGTVISVERKEYNGKLAYVTTIEVGDREYKHFLFDVSPKESLFYKGERIDPDHKDYQRAYNTAMGRLSANATHLLKALGIDIEKFKEFLKKNPAKNFDDYMKKGFKFVPKNWKGKEVDVFLQYQTKIRQGQNMTYLEIPTTLAFGKYLVEHVEPAGEWKEIIDKNGLRYVDDEGNEHPFKRDAEFMSSNRAKRQVKDQEDKEDLDFFDTKEDDDDDMDLPFA